MKNSEDEKFSEFFNVFQNFWIWSIYRQIQWIIQSSLRTFLPHFGNWDFFGRSENMVECSDRPHIVPTCSTRQFYRLREFQGDRSTLPHKKVDFLILGEAISLGTPSYFEGVPICEWFFSEISPVCSAQKVLSFSSIPIKRRKWTN